MGWLFPARFVFWITVACSEIWRVISMSRQPKVAIIMGSDSDFPVVEGGLKILKEFGVDFTVNVCSAHRTPDKAAELAKNAEEDGYDAIIAVAGKAAHLPGVIAAYTVLPVIGLPIKSSTMDGLDSLLQLFRCLQGYLWRLSP